jgi:hypothetical protein
MVEFVRECLMDRHPDERSIFGGSDILRCSRQYEDRGVSSLFVFVHDCEFFDERKRSLCVILPGHPKSKYYYFVCTHVVE